MKSVYLAAAAIAALSSAGAFAQVPPPPGVAQGTTPVAPQPPTIMLRHAAPAASVAPGTRFVVMSDKVMTRAEVTAHVREFFARLDTNHDGFITRDELNSMHQRMMGMGREMGKGLRERGMMGPDRAASFDRLDTNHDGVISRQEYMAARPQVRETRVFVLNREGAGAASGPGMPAMEHMMRMHAMGSGMGMGFGGRLFDMADTNHDGRVSLHEAEAAALAHFDRADLNHDGKLTPEERSQARKMMRGERHPA